MFELIERRDRLDSHDAFAGGEMLTPAVHEDPALQHARDFAERRI